MLENEAGGPSGYKTYQPGVEDPAEAGALAVPLWELSLLAAHFHPHVAQVCGFVVLGGRSRPERGYSLSWDSGSRACGENVC